MLSAFVGEEHFLRGVSIYLKKHLYANSVSKDLWNGIGEATSEQIARRVDFLADLRLELDIAGMMDNWVSKVIHLTQIVC